MAAQHLDQMRSKMGEMSATLGEVQELQKDYLQRKVAENHAQISEQLEEIQAMKIEIIENSL